MSEQKKNRIFKLIIPAIVLAGLSLLVYRVGLSLNKEISADLIIATGTIEATDVDIAAEIGGKIIEFPVDEGAQLERGSLIAKIDTSQLEAEAARAMAALATARATLRDLEAGARSQELQQARAKVELARAKLELDESNWRRTNDLLQQQIISENQLDAAVANRDVSRAQYAVAVEELRLVEAGARPDRIDAARAEVKQAEAALQLIQVRLQKSEIHSPLAGTILVKDAEEGEVVSPGVPLVTVADLNDMWVKIYVDERNIGKVKLGQSAVVEVDAFPDRKFSGLIIYISDEAEFTPKNIQTREDRVKLVFAVKIGIDNAGGLLKPGMYADIELDALSPAFEAVVPNGEPVGARHAVPDPVGERVGALHALPPLRSDVRETHGQQ
jgi:HlyD family secretion protein